MTVLHHQLQEFSPFISWSCTLGDEKFPNIGFYSQSVAIHWEAVKQYFAVGLCILLRYYQVCNFGKLAILDLPLLGVKGLM